MAGAEEFLLSSEGPSNSLGPRKRGRKSKADLALESKKFLLARQKEKESLSLQGEKGQGAPSSGTAEVGTPLSNPQGESSSLYPSFSQQQLGLQSSLSASHGAGPSGTQSLDHLEVDVARQESSQRQKGWEQQQLLSRQRWIQRHKAERMKKATQAPSAEKQQNLAMPHFAGGAAAAAAATSAKATPADSQPGSVPHPLSPGKWVQIQHRQRQLRLSTAPLVRSLLHHATEGWQAEHMSSEVSLPQEQESVDPFLVLSQDQGGDRSTDEGMEPVLFSSSAPLHVALGARGGTVPEHSFAVGASTVNALTSAAPGQPAGSSSAMEQQVVPWWRTTAAPKEISRSDESSQPGISVELASAREEGQGESAMQGVELPRGTVEAVQAPLEAEATRAARLAGTVAHLLAREGGQEGHDEEQSGGEDRKSPSDEERRGEGMKSLGAHAHLSALQREVGSAIAAPASAAGKGKLSTLESQLQELMEEQDLEEKTRRKEPRNVEETRWAEDWERRKVGHLRGFGEGASGMPAQHWVQPSEEVVASSGDNGHWGGEEPSLPVAGLSQKHKGMLAQGRRVVEGKGAARPGEVHGRVGVVHRLESTHERKLFEAAAAALGLEGGAALDVETSGAPLMPRREGGAGGLEEDRIPVRGGIGQKRKAGQLEGAGKRHGRDEEVAVALPRGPIPALSWMVQNMVQKPTGGEEEEMQEKEGETNPAGAAATAALEAAASKLREQRQLHEAEEFVAKYLSEVAQLSSTGLSAQSAIFNPLAATFNPSLLGSLGSDTFSPRQPPFNVSSSGISFGLPPALPYKLLNSPNWLAGQAFPGPVLPPADRASAAAAIAAVAAAAAAAAASSSGSGGVYTPTRSHLPTFPGPTLGQLAALQNATLAGSMLPNAASPQQPMLQNQQALLQNSRGQQQPGILHQASLLEAFFAGMPPPAFPSLGGLSQAQGSSAYSRGTMGALPGLSQSQEWRQAQPETMFASGAGQNALWPSYPLQWAHVAAAGGEDAAKAARDALLAKGEGRGNIHRPQTQAIQGRGAPAAEAGVGESGGSRGDSADHEESSGSMCSSGTKSLENDKSRRIIRPIPRLARPFHGMGKAEQPKEAGADFDLDLHL